MPPIAGPVNAPLVATGTSTRNIRASGTPPETARRHVRDTAPHPQRANSPPQRARVVTAVPPQGFARGHATTSPAPHRVRRLELATPSTASDRGRSPNGQVGIAGTPYQRGMVINPLNQQGLQRLHRLIARGDTEETRSLQRNMLTCLPLR